MKRPEQLLANFLRENKLTIAFAESVSCGMLAGKLATISGTSEVLMGSIVCYNEKVKINLLKVPRKLIDKRTAESQQVTDMLANNLSKFIPADICAAITGLAAPGGSETKTKPLGTIFYSFIYRGKFFRLRKIFRGSPLEIRNKACDYLFKFIIREIKLILKKDDSNKEKSS